MEPHEKKYAVSLGVRIGLAFLLALAMVILVAYYVLSQNFHRLLTDYSIQLVEAMIGQGVTMVEEELDSGQDMITLMADSFEAPDAGERTITFPDHAVFGDNFLRMVYVTETQTAASDGRQRDIRQRQDIRTAFEGETAILGPYFDEDGQYVICYSAPVTQNGRVVGVLGVEQDGYAFCRLIKDIRFVTSGESYIIDADGTDIAVSDPNHIEWVNTQYNGRKILAEQEDPVTRSIVELEQKGLDGETGVGTYEWNNGLVYVAYSPIPSVNWVLLAGLREEEIAAMTQSTLLASVAKGPALKICFCVFFLLAGLTVFWIVASMKKSAEINEQLAKIANHDSLTGLLNRRFLETDLSERWKYPVKVSGQAAVFMADIDNFKKYNDFYGHQKGDDCLRIVAGVFKNAFQEPDSYVIRYGGEEFVAAVFLMDKQAALEKGREICRLVENEKLPDSEGGAVTVSVGVSHVNLTLGVSLYDCIKEADKALYQAKREGKNRAVICDVRSGLQPADEPPAAVG